MNGPHDPSMGCFTDIDWREKGRDNIRDLIMGKQIKLCPDCQRHLYPIDHSLERFGLCFECWENACRKLKICAVCYKLTVFSEDFEKNDVRSLIDWDNWTRTYCSEKCRQIEKSRRWRKNNPEKKQMSNLKYLKDIEKDVKKTLKEKK